MCDRSRVRLLVSEASGAIDYRTTNNLMGIGIDSGAATTASRLGQPDLAIATLNDFVQSAQMMCSLDPKIPVIADADTGLAHQL
jgi:hypothetical protein